MNEIVKNSIRFVAFILIQILIFNQIELGLGTQIMVYPLFIILLPVNMNASLQMLLAFCMGICIDALSNTYGLHSSALVTTAFARPMILQLFAPRDGYDQIYEPNIYVMGTGWFLRSAGILFLIHHFWFFLLELFKLNEILFVLQKTLLSLPISFVICILIQYLFVRKSKATP